MLENPSIRVHAYVYVYVYAYVHVYVTGSYERRNTGTSNTSR